MKRFGFLIFLLILAVAEVAVPIRLNLIAALILLNFVDIKSLIWWLFWVGLTLDLFFGNFLGVNSLILISASSISGLLRHFFWSNLTYSQFPKQTISLTIFQIIIFARIYNFFYDLINFGNATFNLSPITVPFEVVIILILFPIISYLTAYWGSQKQLQLKF